MATGRGYLGKISAVVAANTGDYVRKLNDSASRTKSFANEISGDLRRASSDINKSISSILTPLQRYERAIQNAAAQKLSFRGFDGAIATVEQLRKTIASLSDRPAEVEFVVRQSGLKNIEQVRQVLGDLKQSEVDLAINVGGVAGLRRLREDVQEVDGRTINVKTQITGDRLDQLIEKFSALSPESVRQLQIDVETRQLEQAVVLSDRLKSVTFGVTDAYGAAKQQFAGFSAEVQAALGPAVLQTDRQVTELVETIQSRLPVAESAFQKVAEAARATGRAIKETAELQSRVSALPTGRELAFQNPQLDDLVTRAGRAGESASRLPAGRRASGDVGSLVAEVNRLATAAGVAEAAVAGVADPSQFAAARAEATRLRAEFQAAVELLEEQVPVKVDADEAIRDADRLRATLQSIRDEANFTITGDFQNLRQAEDSVRRIVGDLQKLGTQQSAGLNPQLQNVLAAIELGDITLVRKEYAKLKADFDQELQIKVDADEATAEFVKLRDERNKFRSTPGDPTGPFGPPRPSTDLGDRLADQGRRRVQGLTGNVDFGSSGQAQRDIDAIATRVGNVRQQLESLPNSLRSQFVPALQQAQRELIALQNAPGATVAEIENAANAVQRLERNAQRVQSALNFRAQFGGEGIEGLNRGLDEQAVRGYAAQIQLLQQTIGRVSAEAAGPGVAAQDRLRNAIANAMEDGTIRTARQRQEIERLTAEAVEATAAVSGVGAGGLGRQVQRVGDVGRAGFDRFTLGVNQAVFAIDDFFSVTGGIEQRLRAIGNNVTQLGFLVGGTAGLITALGAVLIGQGLAAYIRFANGGATAEQQSKLLNDALARQKSLVEELAQAFRALGDTLANRVFSEPAQEARRLGRDIEDISKKQRELNRERVAGLDAGVQASRVRQRVLQEEFDGETDPGRRVALQRQITQAREQERRAADAAAARRPSGDEVAAAVERGIVSFRSDEVINRRGEEAALRQQQIRRDAAAAAAAVPRGGSIDDVRAQIRALEQAAEQAPAGTGSRLFGSFGPRGRDAGDLAAIQQLINSLEAPLRQAIDDLSNKTARASFAAASEIEAAQGDVADAIRRGVRGAADFQAALDNTANQLAAAQSQLAAAQEIEDLGQRETAVRRAEDRVRDVGLRLGAINERAREVRLGRGFGGERTTSALSALGGDRFINEEAGLRARLRAAIDAEEQARRSVEAAIARGDDAARELAIKELEAAQAASDLAAAAAEAAVAIEQVFSRLRKAIENIASQSEQLADNAQSALDAQDPRAPGAVNRDELTRERDEAERQLIQDRRRQRELQNRLDRERAEAGNDPRIAGIDRRLEQLRSEREGAAANARLNGVQEDPRAAERRENEIARLEAEREEALRQQTAETRRLIDQENQLIATRRRAAEEIQRQREFEAEVARRRNPQGDAVRGLDLLETPGERAARELAQNLADINEAVDREVERILDRAGGRPQDAEQELADLGARAEDARRRAREDMLRGVAPAIFSLADEVQNSLLQGPSRAALGATDASTIEGQRELNRLLRGDDPNRDVDLAELQKQSNRLLETIADNTGKENQVAN
jgi:hypothetical protein